MRVGTRTVLFGTHSPLVHTWFVARAWTRLYGFPRDPRLWAAFVVHDLGYVGKVEIDGPDGKRHPELGGRIMAALFGPAWGDFTRLHSRHYARMEGKPTSPLCRADKLATAFTPAWLYLPLAFASGEIRLYLAESRASGFYRGDSARAWYARLRAHHAAVARHEQPPITGNGPEGGNR